MDSRVRGRAVPSLNFTKIGATPARPVAAVVEWEDELGNPFLLIAGGKDTATGRVSRVKDGSYAADEDLAPAGVHTDALVFRHDGSDAEASVTFLPLGEGTTMRRRLKNGTYEAVTSADADKLGQVASDLYRAKGHQMSKVEPRGSDPGDNTKWAPEIPLGESDFPIHEVLELGGSPLGAKGDGLFAYNPAPSDARFYNLTPYITPHPDNGKGSFGDGRGRIYYLTVADGILVFRPGSVSQQRPMRFAKIDRNTPYGRIGAMTADAENVYAAIVPGSVRMQQQSFTILREVSGGFTNFTTVLTDGKFADVADFSTVVSGDRIYFGATEPFWGVVLEKPKADNHGLGTFTMAYSNGASSFSSSVTAHDSTIGMTQNGAIVISPGADIVASGAWVARTDTLGPITADLFWLRLSF